MFTSKTGWAGVLLALLGFLIANVPAVIAAVQSAFGPEAAQIVGALLGAIGLFIAKKSDATHAATVDRMGTPTASPQP